MGKNNAIAMFSMGYKILHPWDHTIIGLINMHGPSNLSLMPNIKIIEFAYS